MKDYILACLAGSISVLALFSVMFTIFYTIQPVNEYYNYIPNQDKTKKKIITVKQTPDKIQIKDHRIKLRDYKMDQSENWFNINCLENLGGLSSFFFAVPFKAIRKADPFWICL